VQVIFNIEWKVISRKYSYFTCPENFGDQELPQFAMKASNKGQNPTISIAEAADLGKKQTVQFSLLTGVFGFLLGLLASVVFGKKLSHKGHYHNSSSMDSPFPKTETTPLKHPVA
jgi:hypothetical protein